MYAKLFASLYQGTLRGKSDEILVFTNLLAHCSKEGAVDKHFRAIAEETGLPIERVKTAIEVLESPDPESRSPEEDGARIVRMDEHRVWGWRVVNYGKYRSIRSEDDRAEQNRIAQQKWRDRNKSKPSSATSKQSKPKEREMDKEKHTPNGVQGGDELILEDTESRRTWVPNPIQKRLNALFRRRDTTPWDGKMLKAFRAVHIEEEDLVVLERYYRARIPAGKTDYRRRDLPTLLNNFSGEVDRARGYREISPV